jgi:hypothetical protein
MSKEIQFPVGTKVIVCESLKTTIEKVRYNKRTGEYEYYFKDSQGHLWYESAIAIKKR